MTREIAITIAPDITAALLDYLLDHGLQHLTVVVDHNTNHALGKRIESVLRSQSFDVKTVILEAEEVVPDERSIMLVLVPAEDEQRTYLAVGSGVITDVVRFVSHRTRTRFISLPTAPSVDGYTSVSASLVLDRLKVTINAHPPEAIFADLNTLCAAPGPMIAAGFGDVLAKYTSVADWDLGYLLWDTPYDAGVAQRARNARNRCVEHVDSISRAEPQGVRALLEALIETGLCMLAVGASYPAGGSEHYVSHYLEMKLLQEGRPAILHGAKVGLATISTASYYAKIRGLTKDQAAARLTATPMPDPNLDKDRIRAAYWHIADRVIAEQAPFLEMSPQGYRRLQERVLDGWDGIQKAAADVPPPDQLADWLQAVGGQVEARELGIGEQELELALEVSHFLRSRFTVFKLGRMLGLLN